MANINYTKPNKLEDFSAWCSKKYPLWCKSNFPFIENTFEALDTYGLICKIVQYLNEIKQNLNTTEDNVQNIYDFVTNYFDNLDVQNEINNKLDEMASSGVLQEIISSYLQTQAIFAYNNVEDMKNAENLIEGSFAKTLGYYSINDGGSANYKIRNRTFNDIIDNGSIILMSNENLVAELIKDETLNFKQFGVKFDGITDSTIQLQNALNYGKTNIKGYSGVVCISSPITIVSNDERINIDFKDMTIKCISENIINHVLKIESANNLRFGGKIKNLNIDSQGKSKVGLYINDTLQFNIDNVEITSSTEYDFLIDREGRTQHATIFANDMRLICGHEKGFLECLNASAIGNYAHDNHYENVVTLGYIKHIITTSYGLFNKVHSWNYKEETINNSTMFLSRGGQTSATDCYADTLETMFEMNAGTDGSGSLDAVNSIYYLNPSFYKETNNDPLPIKVSDDFVSTYGRIRISGGRFNSISSKYDKPFINYDTSKENFRLDLLRLNNVYIGRYICSKYFHEYSNKDIALTPSTDLEQVSFYLKKATTLLGYSILNFGATLKSVPYGSYVTIATITDSDFVVKTEESYPMQFINNYKESECVVGLAKITTNKELQIRIPVTEGWSDTASIGMRGTMLNIVQ